MPVVALSSFPAAQGEIWSRIKVTSEASRYARTHTRLWSPAKERQKKHALVTEEQNYLFSEARPPWTWAACRRSSLWTRCPYAVYHHMGSEEQHRKRDQASSSIKLIQDLLTEARRQWTRQGLQLDAYSIWKSSSDFIRQILIDILEPYSDGICFQDIQYVFKVIFTVCVINLHIMRNMSKTEQYKNHLKYFFSSITIM